MALGLRARPDPHCGDTGNELHPHPAHLQLQRLLQEGFQDCRLLTAGLPVSPCALEPLWMSASPRHPALVLTAFPPPVSGPLGCSEGPRLWAVYPPRSLLFRRKEARPAFFRGGLSFSRPAVRKWPREGGHTLGAWLLWEHEGKALGIPTWQKSPVPSGLVGNELNARPRAPALPTPRVSHCGQLRPAAQGPLGQLRALGSGSGRAGPVPISMGV